MVGTEEFWFDRERQFYFTEKLGSLGRVKDFC